jgi:uncharacterized protein YneF (UPF0154 family)
MEPIILYIIIGAVALILGIILGKLVFAIADNSSANVEAYH